MTWRMYRLPDRSFIAAVLVETATDQYLHVVQFKINGRFYTLLSRPTVGKETV